MTVCRVDDIEMEGLLFYAVAKSIGKFLQLPLPYLKVISSGTCDIWLEF